MNRTTPLRSWLVVGLIACQKSAATGEATGSTATPRREPTVERMIEAPVTAMDMRGDKVFVLVQRDDDHEMLERCSIDACANPDEIAPIDGLSHSIRAGDDAVYVVTTVGVKWRDGSPDSSNARSCILRVGLDGHAEPLLTLPLRDGEVMRSTLDGGYVYFTADGPLGGAIARVPMAGGPIESLARIPDQRPFAIVVDGPLLYFTSNSRRARGKQQEAGFLSRMPKDGGPVQIIATTDDAGRGLAIDGDTIYWSTWPSPLAAKRDTSELNAMVKTGGGVRTLLKGVELDTVLAVANRRVYAFEVDGSDSYRLVSVPTDGGDAVTLAKGSHSPTAVAVSPRAVVWASTDFGGSRAGSLQQIGIE